MRGLPADARSDLEASMSKKGEASAFLYSAARWARRCVKPLLKPLRLHILFVVHNHAGLHNFDDCLRGFLRDGHKVTIALPEPKPGRHQRSREWRGGKEGDVSFRFAPRARDDRWETMATYIRKGRTYLLYRKSIFAGANFLQERVAETTPRDIKVFFDRPLIRRWPRMTDFVCRVLEAGIPAAESAKRFIADLKPDVVLITPYIAPSTRYQIEYAKAAKEFGVPVGVAVHSWDNLTSKEVIQVRPDRLFVWNRTQLKEAVSLHNMPASRVTVTGGMRFAKFFGVSPRISKEEFCESVGLDRSKPILTYLGSSYTVAPEEHLFLWRWIEALRAAEEPTLRECNVFVRPHPHNSVIWDHWPSKPPARVALWDGRGNDVRGVIESVGHSVAVVGINTTAMLEAAALGKPVLTVIDDELRAGQVERIHFHYLTSVAGGLVTPANGLDEHLEHLVAIFGGDPRFSGKSKKFAKVFLRPPWPYRSPVKAFQKAVEQLAWSNYPKPIGGLFLPILLRPAVEYLARRLTTERDVALGSAERQDAEVA
jgi:hypothetical protein